MIFIATENISLFLQKSSLIYYGDIIKEVNMAGFTDFIKEIFMLTPDKGLVGLSGIKQSKKSAKKNIAKSSKKSEVKLSDLMRKNNKIEV